jgi:hypothetical protein
MGGTGESYDRHFQPKAKTEPNAGGAHMAEPYGTVGAIMSYEL